MASSSPSTATTPAASATLTTTTTLTATALTTAAPALPWVALNHPLDPAVDQDVLVELCTLDAQRNEISRTRIVALGGAPVKPPARHTFVDST